MVQTYELLEGSGAHLSRVEGPAVTLPASPQGAAGRPCVGAAAGAGAGALPREQRGCRGSSTCSRCVRCRGLVAGSAITVLLLGVPLALTIGGFSPGSASKASAIRDAMTAFDFDTVGVGMDLYNRAGGFNPFRFKCPVPGVDVVHQLLGKGGTEAENCCRAYDELKWPYIFPECRRTSNCSTCWAGSGLGALKQHANSDLAAVAWAANVAVYSVVNTPMLTRLKGFVQTNLMGKDVTLVKLQGGAMRGKVREGLVRNERDLCPRIHDWEVDMLHEDDENIQVRLYKSANAKLAVIVFRGTEQTSRSNWQVDFDIRTVELQLGENGERTLVHKGFLEAVKRILPQLRKWVNGHFFLASGLPLDWRLLFTGHSLGGALAVLAATLAEQQGWLRRPDATIVFGSPRVADSGLDRWWRERGLCRQLLRVNVYNDVIHWMPFLETWKSSDMMRDFLGCIADVKACLKRGPMKPTVKLSDRWTHVCSESEFLVPGASRGVNEHLVDFSPAGGGLAHLTAQCLYGYGFGVAHGGILERDGYCGIGPSICPSWADTAGLAGARPGAVHRRPSQ
mmetsp:Transcript_65774/g.186744  ORF Transcript_65774/g.186744 Transcript_65774/m.186744 type:complete len:566 (+) Transcript_65774:24-1721(+)